MAQDTTSADTRPTVGIVDIIRVVILLAAMASLALWGFSSWSLPWNFIVGIGAPLVILLVWALFLSPRPVLLLHPYVRAVVELLIYAGVTVAWWSMGQVWIGLSFAVVAIVAGLVSGRRSLR